MKREGKLEGSKQKWGWRPGLFAFVAMQLFILFYATAGSCFCLISKKKKCENVIQMYYYLWPRLLFIFGILKNKIFLKKNLQKN